MVMANSSDGSTENLAGVEMERVCVVDSGTAGADEREGNRSKKKILSESDREVVVGEEEVRCSR